MNLWKWPRVRITESEYRANMSGLNIFFGAVLGFVITGAERLAPLSFAILLVLCAGIVVSILYISAARRPIFYILFSAVLIAVLPRICDPLFASDEELPAKLQPALAVWAAMIGFIELLPRGPDPAAQIVDKENS